VRQPTQPLIGIPEVGGDLAVRYRPIHRVNRAVPSGARRCWRGPTSRGEQISGRDVAATVLIDAATRCSAIPGQAGRHPAYPLGRVPALRDSAGPNQLRWESHELRTSARRRHGGVIRHRTATAMRLADAGWHGYAEVWCPDDGEALLERDGGIPVMLAVTSRHRFSIVCNRKAFGLPAPGSRATAGVVRGATR
jgi:hypothetical protein